MGAINLSGQDLTGVDLSGANLTGANLQNANLTGANLQSANLTNANLSGADLTNANLSGAIILGALFAGAFLISTIFGFAPVLDFGSGSGNAAGGLEQIHTRMATTNPRMIVANLGATLTFPGVGAWSATVRPHLLGPRFNSVSLTDSTSERVTSLVRHSIFEIPDGLDAKVGPVATTRTPF